MLGKHIIEMMNEIHGVDNYETITLTSSNKYNKSKKNTEIKLGNNKIEVDDDESVDSVNTLTTDDIKHININNIHTVDKYTLKALKTLALYHNIQQSKKNGNKWKPLSKIELYNKIHDYLEQNNKVNL